MEKFFTKSSEINFLMLLISYLAYPLTLVLVMLKIKPNSITCISLLLAICASYQFILGNFKYFFIFWILSLLLDFCDGQVARISKLVNKTAFNFDLLSDILKFFIIILSSAIYYNTEKYWIISFFFIFLFLFYQVLVAYYENKKKTGLFQAVLKKHKIYIKIFKQFKHFFFRIDGHSHLLFLFLGLNINYALLAIVYMQFVLLLNIFRVGYLLTQFKI
jgi:phosphatidylglycerophosphate synthase